MNALARRSEPYLLLCLLGIALFLRLYQLDYASLWADEIGQVLVAKGTLWDTILRSAEHTASTPLDYIVTHLVYRWISHTDWVLRLPAVLWSTLAVWAIYAVARRLFTKPVAFLTAFLLAIMPLAVQYAQEARFYGLTTLLALLMLYTFLAALDKNTRRRWTLYGGVLALALYAHYYVTLITAIMGIWLAWAIVRGRFSRTVLRRWGIAAGAALVLFMPWAYYDLIYRHDMASRFPFWDLFPPRLIELLPALFMEAQVNIDTVRGVVIVFVALLLVGAGFALRPRWSRPALVWPLRLFLMVLFGGTAAAVWLDYRSGYNFAARQFLIYTPFALLAIAATYDALLQAVSRRIVRLLQPAFTVAAGTALLATLSLAILWQPLVRVYSPVKEDWRGLARYLQTNMGPGDILISPYTEFIAFYAPELASTAQLPTNGNDLLADAQTHPHTWALLLSWPLSDRPAALTAWLADQHVPEVPVGKEFRLYRYTSDGTVVAHR